MVAGPAGRRPSEEHTLSTRRHSSPVAGAVFNSLDLLEPGAVGRGAAAADAADHLVLSYRDRDDFSFLWSLFCDAETDDGMAAWVRRGGAVRKVTLVWDGVPSPSGLGGVALAEYVTPYDWMVALELTILADGRGVVGDKSLQVTVVDLISGGEPRSGAAGLFRCLRRALAPLMPWARVYRAGPPVAGERRTHGFLVDQLLRPPSAAEPHGRGASGPAARPDPSLLRRLWSPRLLAPAEPRDRHAVANLIGPQLLIASMRPQPPTAAPGGAVCLGALLTLMRALGLTRPGQRNTYAPWVSPDTWEGAGEVAIVLVDDMHALGWAEFVRLALGLGESVQRRPNLLLSDAPDARKFGPRNNRSLIDLLADGGRLRLSAGLKLQRGAGGAILFLDLRLFSQRPPEDEFGFFGRLLELARQAVDEGGAGTKLAWRGFTRRDIKAVENCIAGRKVEDDDYFIALTLLPRLIALVDPTLPVILFSSTGQRQVVEALRGYESIILDFDKPRFFGGLKDEMAEDARDRFARAFARALKLLEGGRVCRSFNAPTPSAGSPPKDPYVEIYIDESEDVSDPQFRVGGLSLVFDGEKQARRFNEELVRGGIVWGSTDVDDRPVRCLPKQKWPGAAYEKNVFGPAARMLRSVNAPLAFGFSLAAPPDLKWKDSTDLTSPSCLDNLYRSLILQLLEVLFFEVLPGELGQESPSFGCGVYVANRTRHQSDADAPSDWDRHSERNITRRFGVRVKKSDRGSLYFNSVTSETVYPMVAQVKALQPEADIVVSSARGSQLIYGVNPTHPESLPRPAHLLADLVVRFSKNRAALGSQPTLRGWLERGFRAVADEDFETTLRACRHARAGRNVEAIREARNAAQSAPDGRGLAAWARPRIARAVASLTGREFADLCARL